MGSVGGGLAGGGGRGEKVGGDGKAIQNQSAPHAYPPGTSACIGFRNLSDNHHGEDNLGEP